MIDRVGDNEVENEPEIEERREIIEANKLLWLKHNKFISFSSPYKINKTKQPNILHIPTLMQLKMPN